MFKENFPPIETAMELEPEELAPFILKSLSGQQQINRYNFSISSQEMIDYAGRDKYQKFCENLMEGWMWLEKENFLAPKPGEQGDWAFITRKGRRILEEQNFDTYKRASLLPSDNLDPVLVRKVKPSFIRGDYETAIFQSFKEVEVRVRKKSGSSSTEIGVNLMRKAFKVGDGPLSDKNLPPAEQEAMMSLFAGAVGLYKNPSSHRDVDFSDPGEAVDIIHTANNLLKIVDKIKTP